MTITTPTAEPQRSRPPVEFLPEPEPRARRYTVFSVDDHLVEPPDTFAGRLPARFADVGPRVVETPDGAQQWLFEDRLIPNIGLNAVAGMVHYSFEPSRFDEMRQGAWDVHARIREMDIDGTWASLCFPSFVSGFAGRRLSLEPNDPDLALAALRAYNSWHLEEWVGPYPDRFVPLQLPWLRDPVLAAEEIRANAARGFKAVSFPESPHKLGLPSIYSREWDPFFAACEETGTVVNLHFGSAGSSGAGGTLAPDAVEEAVYVSTPLGTQFIAIDWLYSKVVLRFPELRIVLTEGGIGWVAALIDRLDHAASRTENAREWVGSELTPSELLRRNFWFPTLDDPSTFATRHAIGVENILIEVDYPHADSSWPDTQAMLDREFAGVPDDEIELITWRNAAELYRHPVPDHVVQGVSR